MVYGKLLSPGAHHTLTAYQIYDIQPVGELDQWASGPFEAKLVDDIIVARGAINSKGALVAELMAIKALRETIGVPTNIVFTFDDARAHKAAIRDLGFKQPLIYPMSRGTSPSMYYTAAPLKMVSASSGSDAMPPHYAHALTSG